MKSFHFILVLMMIVSIAGGCSSGKSLPLYPPNDNLEYSMPEKPSESIVTSRKLLGVWTITLDMKSLSATMIPDRDLASHFNVTSMLPSPQIVINYYNPVARVVDADVTISNPTDFNAYDVRGIILSGYQYQILLNADHWTTLYDVPGGNQINPFKAYAKSQPYRKFSAHSNQTENYQLYMPQGNMDLKFVVDASYPSNCEEPYAITNFSHGSLKNYIGSSTTAEVYVNDWQDDVSDVNLHCPDVTGQVLVPFHYVGSNKWEIELINATGAHSGEYVGWLMAKSTDSGNLALYEMVVVTVSYALPLNPKIVGALYFNDSYRDIYVDSDYAYIADGSNGLKILDITDPREPKLISCCFSEKGYSKEIFVRDNLAYIAGFDDGLAVIDVSDKLNPKVIGNLSLSLYTVYGLACSGSYIYLAIYNDGILVVDVSNPANPQVAGSVAVRYMAMGICIEGNYAYIAEGYNGITVFDISTPVSPVQVGYVDTPGKSCGIDIIGDIAYIADYSAGLTIVDVSNHSQPEVINNLAIPNYPHMVEISGNYAFVGNISGLTILDAGDSSNPLIIGEFTTEGFPQSVGFSGNNAFIAADSDGMNVLDITDPALPVLIASTDSHREAETLDVSGDKAYLTGTDGWKIVDLADPRKPQLMSVTPLNGCVDVEGTYAYIGIVEDCGSYQRCAFFYIVDIHDPMNPAVVYDSSVFVDYTSIMLKTYNEYLCVIYSSYVDTFMEIYDISTPWSPVNLSNSSIPTGIWCGPEIMNGYLYFGSSAGVSIIDVRDPYNPVFVITYGIQAWLLTGFNRYMITSNNTSLSIYEMSNPIVPAYVGSINIGDRIFDMKAAGNFIYVLTENEGLKTVSMTDPVNPIIFSSLDIPGVNLKLIVQENYAYITKGTIGFYVVQLW